MLGRDRLEGLWFGVGRWRKGMGGGMAGRRVGKLMVGRVE